jgi:DNA gyrase subunit B
MRPLIDGGYVYIAQPPLYKIKRGKREEYVETEDEMSGIILEMGTEGVKLIKAKDKQAYTTGQFMEILNICVDVQRIIEIMSKRGLDFQEYIENYNQKTKKMPLYRVKVEGKTHFVYDDKELSELTTKDEEAQYTEIFSKEDLENSEKNLNKFGLSTSEFLSQVIIEEPTVRGASKKKGESKEAPAKKAARKPLFVIEDETEKQDAFSLQEVLEHVRAQAKKGMHLQRYKGLGEMNPQQLWETTMDPERRTILKVTLEDSVEAEGIFSVLMGDEVAPRREFIESNAHEVKDLDI